MQTKHSLLGWVTVPILGLLLLAAGYYTKSNFSEQTHTFILPVPFSPQAPTNNWDRNEDCEETSITMANAYLTGNTIKKLPAQDAQGSIDTLKAWEEQHIGYNANTGSEATAAMAEGAFNLKIKKLKNYSSEDLKQALRDNHPILLPINARLLGNPKYEETGPLYHMVVVRGFEDDVFVINDPGTEGGEGNKYTFEVLKHAGADWDQHNKTMEPNSKIALVVYK